MRLIKTEVKKLKPHPKNARVHNEKNIKGIMSSLESFGQMTPIVVWSKRNYVIKGCGTLLAAKRLGWKHINIVRADSLSSDDALKYSIADNKTTDDSEFDKNMLEHIMKSMSDKGIDLSDTGFCDYEIEPLLCHAKVDENNITNPPDKNNTLAKQFGAPPFSVFDSKQGYWAEGKRKWDEKYSLHSEAGREHMPCTIRNPSYLQKGSATKGGSVFDPYLTEIIYRWYSKEGDTILDPFAGGITRGLVAAAMGRNYYGIDLSKKQVDANIDKMSLVKKSHKMSGNVKWIVGDAVDAHKLLPKNFNADLVFSCPPYYNLEKYSNNAKDFSNLSSYQDFIDGMCSVFTFCKRLLRKNGYMIFVIGDVFDRKNKRYYGVEADFVNIGFEVGLNLIDSVVYLTPIGSAPMRSSCLFKRSDKLTRVHQMVYIFKNA